MLDFSPSGISNACAFQNVPHWFYLLFFFSLFLSLCFCLGIFYWPVFPFLNTIESSDDAIFHQKGSSLSESSKEQLPEELIISSESWIELGWGYDKDLIKLNLYLLDSVPRACLPQSFNCKFGKTLLSQIWKTEGDSVLPFRI